MDFNDFSNKFQPMDEFQNPNTQSLFLDVVWAIMREKILGFWASSSSYYIGEYLSYEKIYGFELKIRF